MNKKQETRLANLTLKQRMDGPLAGQDAKEFSRLSTWKSLEERAKKSAMVDTATEPPSASPSHNGQVTPSKMSI